MQEQMPLPAENLRRRLLNALRTARESGGMDPEAVRLLDEWTREKEKTVPARQPERNKAAILLNVERARLYRDSGYIQEAVENYEAALAQLGNEVDPKFADDTVEVIYAEMDELPQS